MTRPGREASKDGKFEQTLYPVLACCALYSQILGPGRMTACNYREDEVQMVPDAQGPSLNLF